MLFSLKYSQHRFQKDLGFGFGGLHTHLTVEDTSFGGLPGTSSYSSITLQLLTPFLPHWVWHAAI